MKKESIQLVFSKPMEINPVTFKPLLLFVMSGYDEEKKMRFIRINGIRNPLPFKEAYGINILHVKSWLETHGWKKIGLNIL